MKKYELTVLIRPDLEIDLEAPLSKVRALISDNGGKISLEDNWGKKKLSYSIAKENFAIYVYFEVELPPAAPLKISDTLNITDSVIRYLLVKTDEKGRALLEEAEKKQAESSESRGDSNQDKE